MQNKELQQWIQDLSERLNNDIHDELYIQRLKKVVSGLTVKHSWNGYVILINGLIFSSSRPGIYKPVNAGEGIPQYLPGDGLLYHCYDYERAKEVLGVLKKGAPEGVKIRMAKVEVIDEEEQP